MSDDSQAGAGSVPAKPGPLEIKFLTAIKKHAADLEEYVKKAQTYEVLKARIETWTRSTAATLDSFELREAARDLRLVRGQHDVMGDEYLSSRPDALYQSLVETVEHVAKGRFPLVDPDAVPPPTAQPSREHRPRSEDRIQPRRPYSPDRRVVSMAPPSGSRPVKKTRRSPPEGSPPPVHVHQHFGDVIGRDKNTSTGAGPIVTEGELVAAELRSSETASKDLPAPTSPLGALADVVAPPNAHPLRHKAWRALLILLGIVGLAAGALALAPQDTKTKVWDALTSWAR